MTKTPEVVRSAVADAASEKLVLAADVDRQLRSLAAEVPPIAANEAPLTVDEPLTVATQNLIDEARTPQEVAAITLQRVYPRGA